MRKISIFALVAILGQCGGRPEAVPEPSSGPPAPETSVPPAQAASVAGYWALRRTDSLWPGMQLELLFDSIAGSSFRARIAFLMQGDMGLDTSRFEPALGSIRPDSMLSVTFRAGLADLANRLSGKVRGDTIALTEFLWAGENWLRSGAPWVLVRERR